MLCRKPIVLVRRYGRIINKTAIDLMERVFYEQFSRSQARLNSEIAQVAQQLKDTEPHVSDKNQNLSIIQNLKNIEKKVMAGARDYQELIAMCQRYSMLDISGGALLCCSTPSIDIYKKIRSAILGKAKEEKLSQEEIEMELSRLTVPKPDPSRACA